MEGETRLEEVSKGVRQRRGRPRTVLRPSVLRGGGEVVKEMEGAATVVGGRAWGPGGKRSACV